MKLKSVIFTLRQSIIVLILILALAPTAKTSAQPLLLRPGNISQGVIPGAQKSVAATSGCQWTYYPISGGKLQPEQLLFNDPDNTPLTNLSVGNLFKGKSTQLANTGSADFNGDNKTDVFRTIPGVDGNLQWQYSSSGTGAWQNLASAPSTLPVSLLQFGNFNSDTKTDVFASQFDNLLPGYQWMYSSGGTSSFSNLSSTSFPPDLLALGDFNGDGVTDVFTANLGASTYNWAYSPGGTGSAVPLAHSDVDPSLLRFGDFNGDGTTDVFAATQAADGSTQWLYSSGGAASFTNLATTTIPYSELQFGDFNGDGKTDVLAAEPQSDGSLKIVYWPGGTGSGVTLGNIAAPAPALRVGDFNGDSISDLMALRCGMNGPLAFNSIQILANSGFSTFYTPLSGDVNGDGVADVILVSTCQAPSSFGICATNHLQVGTALGTPGKTYTLVAPQQLGTDNFQYYKALPGDFNGDGKTDLALVDVSATNPTVYVALSNGNGTFTLESSQTFGVTLNGFNLIVGDFNGDGKADLAFASVCSFASGSCTNGDSNTVYVATSSGAGVFSIGAQQTLGPASGWANYTTFAGDFNGDGKTDLVFNSTCQKTNFIDSTCTIGDANLVYTALSTGSGSFTLSSQQEYGASGWSDYSMFSDLTGDVNGDGRPDLVWSSSYQAAAKTTNNLVVVGFANPDGTFGLGSTQNFGSTRTGGLTLADLNQDGKADLLWNKAPQNDTDVDTYAAATSNGNGTFKDLGQGSVYTGQGYFQLPGTGSINKLPAGLTIVSTRQDSISNALFVVDGALHGSTVYLPLLKK
jgi:hypothetical protein